MDSISLDKITLESTVAKDKPLTVSELVALLKADVEHTYRQVRVVGEISSFKQWRSGHCYFDIKDAQALLPAVMFRPHFLRVPFKVAAGMQILFTGRVSIYAANARLQMVVETMEPLGQGALLLAFEQLKERLMAEGLFDPKHKKPIKTFNQCIGLITSSHGAVIRDMVRILKSRMPKVNIVFSAVRVQGEGAAQEIARAIKFLDNFGGCDVIIVGRGGGSLEDLWAFNEEVVARSIFLAKTPIISAVGHETDTTVSDFVADVRAATPTHAATLVVPDIKDILAKLSGYLQSFTAVKLGKMRNAALNLMREKQRLKDPRVLLFRHWQGIDELSARIHELLQNLLKRQKKQLVDQKISLQTFAPLYRVRQKREAFFKMRDALIKLSPVLALKKAEHERRFLEAALHERSQKFIVRARENLRHAGMKLDALSPLQVLARGYSLVQNESGTTMLSQLADFSLEQSIRIRVEDGSILARVLAKEGVNKNG